MRSNRWRIFLVAILFACAIAAFSQAKLQLDDAGVTNVSEEAPRKAPKIPSVVPISPTESAPDIDSDVDPFAPRNWQTPVTETARPTPVAATIIAAPIDPQPVPTAPPLPFTFMGRLNDGVSAMVYLSRGEESWSVKGGETLDGNYKVLSVTPQQIVFEHVPTGSQQTLVLPEADK